MDAPKKENESLQEFKQNVKCWMKEHRVKADDFALWLNKSVGTIKNWLYTPINITKENQKLIFHYMEQYEKGLVSINGGCKINTVSPWQDIAFIPVNVEAYKLSYIEWELWCMSAEVSTDFLNETPSTFSPLEDCIKFAEWFTSKVMEYTASVIAPVYEEKKEKKIKFNLSEYMTGGEFTPSRMEPVKIENITEYLPDDPTIFEHPYIFLPVNRKEWKSAYLVAAAKINNQSPYEFIISFLKKESEIIADCSLQDFLNSTGAAR